MNALPSEFLSRMHTMLKDEYDSFLNSYEKPSYQALRINTRKTSASNILFRDALTFDFQKGTTFAMPKVPWCETGYYYPENMRPGKHIYHEAGAYYIQEPSAMAPAVYLDAKPGETILDLCAAPGGKSTQIATMMQGEGLLISNEIHPARAKILSENIERMGITNAVVTNETPASLSARFASFFDRIMVDAPCSGEGMFRKNEEACSQWSLHNVFLCASRQDEILNEADKMLKPGGRIVFSTCTFAPAENEGSIGRFLASHPDYILSEAPLYEGMSRGLLCDSRISMCDSFSDSAFAKHVADHVIRLWPHKLNGEGHFVAVLQKRASNSPIAPLTAHTVQKEDGLYLCAAPTDRKRTMKNKDDKGNKKGSSKTTSKKADGMDVLQEINAFAKEVLQINLSGGILLFGEQIYLVPDGMPSITGLKVLRPGLHIGSIQKDRFEPSHALALALRPDDCHPDHVCRFFSENKKDYLTACHFIEGQTFPYEGEKGWFLITLDDLSIGWGRLAGGIMKNHYPKGLRKYLL